MTLRTAGRLTAAASLAVVLAAACTESSKPAKPETKSEKTDKIPDKAPPPPPVPKVELAAAPALALVPLGLPELKAPDDNPLTAEKAALGKELFFDKRLSAGGQTACASCHVHDKAWTDGQAVSIKADGKPNTRHSPTLYNVGYHTSWYWDGRSPTLEKQIAAAWKGQVGSDDPGAICRNLMQVPQYAAEFQRAFKADCSPENVDQAIASFLRTLLSGDSPWDRYEKGDKGAVSADQVAGYKLFTGKAQCSLCHVPPLYTDGLFHNVGVGMDAKEPDPGRGKISKDDKETGAFMTPTLRAVTRRHPYFHDGHEASLDAAIKFMVGGGAPNPHLDPKLKPVKLSTKEMDQLSGFITSLDSTEMFEDPKLP